MDGISPHPALGLSLGLRLNFSQGAVEDLDDVL